MKALRDTLQVVGTVAIGVALCAALWWLVGATFGFGYLGFKFVVG
jgi:hypothetical protein